MRKKGQAQLPKDVKDKNKDLLDNLFDNLLPPNSDDERERATYGPASFGAGEESSSNNCPEYCTAICDNYGNCQLSCTEIW